ncbi:ABC transporter permease subunit [Paenibacillus albidus]|uniref:ABC transporter permease subunit n=1 Tax=Paenibacillus albidus TaxID=2041023 RepID=UPI0035714799
MNALNEVPEDYYEAASIDGANTWNKSISITLPSIQPVLSAYFYCISFLFLFPKRSRRQHGLMA